MKKTTQAIIVFSLIYITLNYLLNPNPEELFYNAGLKINNAQQQFKKGYNKRPKKVKIYIPAISKDSIVINN